MNWESHWSKPTHEFLSPWVPSDSESNDPQFPIHGAPSLASASASWSPGTLLALGAVGVIGGAILGDIGLLLFMNGMGWKA